MEKLNRKFYSVALFMVVLLFAFALVACQDSSEEHSSSAKASKGEESIRKKIGIPKMMQMHYWTKNRKWLKLKRIMSRIESSQHLMEIHAHKWVLIGIRQMNLMMHKYG